MQKKEIMDKISELYENCFAAYLGTVDENKPCIRAVENLRYKKNYPELEGFFKNVENPFDFYFATFTDSAKYKQMKKNSEVVIYLHDGKSFFGVTLHCIAYFIDDLEIKKKLWAGKFDYFWKNYKDKDYGIVKLNPYAMEGWTGERIFNYSL